MSHAAQRIDASHAEYPCFWGIDVGGTSIKLGLVDLKGRTVFFDTVPTLETLGGQAAINRVAEVVRRVEQSLQLTHDQIPGIGLGSPGTMDLGKGILVDPPNLPNWKLFPIRKACEEALARPVTFLNDANAAAYGEFWLGAGRGQSNMILFTLGTGVGGGVIVDGGLINGVNSSGSELGHVIVDSREDAELCVWGGGRGHLEAYASASAVVARARKQLRALPKKSSILLDDDQLSAKAIYLAAEEGDRFALDMIDDTAKWLGIGICSAVHVIDPGLVVLGGAMNFGGSRSESGRRFLAKVVEEFARRTFANVASGTKIQFAELGSDAGYLGAAGWHAHCRHAIE
jgi:glucokinase